MDGEKITFRILGRSGDPSYSPEIANQACAVPQKNLKMRPATKG
jgi:hypothetical protein